MQRLVYGRRKGHRLRPGRQRLLEELLPRLQVHLPAGDRLDPVSLFARRPERIWLEIGFGGGEHLAAQAAAHPEVGLIGCEPFITGVARLLSLIQTQDLTNIRLFTDDARLLMQALPNNCLERVFVLFPDPWPKTRHAGRRFIGAANLDRLAVLLKDAVMPTTQIKVSAVSTQTPGVPGQIFENTCARMPEISRMTAARGIHHQRQ